MPNNAHLTAKIHALFSEGRLDKCLEMANDDVVVHFVPAGQTFHGREGFMQFISSFHNAFPDIRVEHTNILSEGDQTAVEFTWSGTHTGSLVTPAGTIPPTGKRLSGMKVAELMTWRHGKVLRIANYQDLGTLLRALGV